MGLAGTLKQPGHAMVEGFMAIEKDKSKFDLEPDPNQARTETHDMSIIMNAMPALQPKHMVGIP